MTVVLSLILVSIFLPIVGISFLHLPPLTLAGRRGKSWSCRPFFFVPLTGVEVDHIVHLLSTSVYSPIMSVERWFVSKPCINSRTRWQLCWISFKTDQLWPATYCTSSSFFPLKDLWPSSLVDGIVDQHNSWSVLKEIQQSCHLVRELIHGLDTNHRSTDMIGL